MHSSDLRSAYRPGAAGQPGTPLHVLLEAQVAPLVTPQATGKVQCVHKRICIGSANAAKSMQPKAAIRVSLAKDSLLCILWALRSGSAMCAHVWRSGQGTAPLLGVLDQLPATVPSLACR